MRSKLAIFIALFFLITSYNETQAQDNKNSVELSPFVGLGLFSVNQYAMKGNFWGAEGVYHLNMANNQSEWVRLLRLHDISFVLSYRHNDDVYLTHESGSTGFLGDSYGITTRLAISLFNVGATSVRFTPGFGFAYATQTFYTNDNPLTGSHINFTAQAGVRVLTPISPTTRLSIGLDLYHYSNAAIKLPNDGVNTLNASLGIDHDIDTDGPNTPKSQFENSDKGSFEFSANVGRRGIIETAPSLTGEKAAAQKKATSHLYKSGFYAGYGYRLNPLLGLKLGTDAVYYYTPYKPENYYGTFQELATSYDKWTVGISGGADIYMGRVVFDINYGQYIHFDNYKGTGDSAPTNWYWTFGGKYFFNQWFAIEATQYLHKEEADFVGLGFLVKIH